MAGADTPSVTISRLDYRVDTEFVASPTPTITWVTETTASDWMQEWAEIDASGEVVRIDGRASVRVAWPFAPLAPRETRTLRVRVGGSDGTSSPWSEPRVVRAGFVGDGEWVAQMIGLNEPVRAGQPALLRREIHLASPITRATLYSTGQGIYQVEVNGKPVDEDTLKPGWTAYQWRLIHETNDVTGLLRPGANVLGIQLTAGWYAQKYGFGDDAAPFYGDQPSAALQLVVDYEDGSVETFATDEDWRAFGEGPVVDAGIFAGQHDDLRGVQKGWSEPAFDGFEWTPVRVSGSPVPEARFAPPVRQVDLIQPAAISASNSGATILDFGQNLVGRLRVRADLPEGAKITIRHAEILSNGELNTGTMGGADATDSFVSAGQRVVWEPLFTFRGFRYAEISGWPGEVPSDAVTAVVVSSDLERTGWLDTSNLLVNRLHESVVWSTRGNFISLPTDCPQRDERLGWTGDIEVFTPTAATLFDVDGLLTNWLADVANEQTALDGVVPFVVPNISSVFVTPTAGWGDSAVGVPWNLYERFDDVTALERQYDSMKRWVDLVDQLAGDAHLWQGGFQFGDWLDPTAPENNPTDAKTDKELIATAYFYRSATILAKTAALLDRTEDAEKYEALAAEIKAAFADEYVTRNGRLSSDAQTAYALTIVFGLADNEATERAMGHRLAWLVRRNGYRIGTGFLGTPVIVEALARTGQLRTADRLLTQTECPSWLYPITQGATTTWEAWDAVRPDGSVHPGNRSLNHYAFGAIADWLHGSLAGLRAEKPGYAEIRIQPVLLPSFTSASSTRVTPYGRAQVAWQRDGTEVTLTATIPANTRAVVQLPDESAAFEVGSGSHRWTVDVPVEKQPTVADLSLQTQLVDVIEDPDAYAAVVAAFTRHAPHFAQVLQTQTKWEPGVTLDAEFFILPKPVQSQIEVELALFRREHSHDGRRKGQPERNPLADYPTRMGDITRAGV